MKTPTRTCPRFVLSRPAAGLIAAMALVGGARAAPPADTPVVISAARLYTAPDAPPIEDAVVVLRGGKIAAAGRRADVSIPPDARVESACNGGTVTAGFQNSHVHFIGPSWEGAATGNAAAMGAELTRMFTRYGFTTVVDLASNLDDTLALRARIERGEIPGPRVLTASWPLFPEKGLPIYIMDMPAKFLSRLPQPATPEAAVKQVEANLDAGANATKLFIVTPQGHGQVKTMPIAIARAAVEASHRRGAMVFVHPTDFAGAEEAVDAGADILAHDAFDDGAPWPDALLHKAIAAHVAMIPTLKLLPYELAKEQVPPGPTRQLVAGVVAHVRTFAAAGGEILFGTDVGYMSDVDPTQEYTLMADAGLSPMRILASLTTAPAARWKESDHRGRVAPGFEADLVVLAADPAADVANFAKAQCTFRGGQAIYVAPR
jgi:imidazolonepropionase-like amidohydrolase